MTRAQKSSKPKAPKTIAGTRSLSSFVKSICDIMRRSNCASALQHVPEFFTKGKKTAKIWYYGLTHLKIGKKLPMTLAPRPRWCRSKRS